MEAIYRTFWGSYIDLDKLVKVTCFLLDNDKELTVCLDFQLREKTIKSEISIHDFEVFEESNIAYLAGNKIEFNNTTKYTDIDGIIHSCDSMDTMRSGMMYDWLQRQYVQFIEDWKKYKKENKKL